MCRFLKSALMGELLRAADPVAEIGHLADNRAPIPHLPENKAFAHRSADPADER